MSTFEVRVVRIDSSEKHPNADSLTMNRVGGYVAITNIKEDGTWRFQTGDLAVYVPENAVLPEAILKQYGYWQDTKKDGTPIPLEEQKGFLGGRKGDRVRPMRLRGIYSEGLLFPVTTGAHTAILNGDDALDVVEGDDVAVFLEITKYEPPIPSDMSGQVFAKDGLGRYDLEAYERYPEVFVPGERVVAYEKLHGTFTGMSFLPGEPNENAPEHVYVYSKGLGWDGLSFVHGPVNATNLYLRMYRELFGLDKPDGDKRVLRSLTNFGGGPVHMFGETFGRGVQDLHYGQKNPTFRLFDVYVGAWGQGAYLDDDELVDFASHSGIRLAPRLYVGEFDPVVLESIRDGKDAISQTNVREGIVVRAAKERRDAMLGRVILKMVSPNYKLRRNGGEEFS